MIIDVFVAQRQTIDPLCQHLLYRVLNPLRLPSVKKTGGQWAKQVQPLLRLSQQQRSAIGGDGSTIESGYNLPSLASFKSETRLDTLCHKKSRSLLALTAVWKLSYAMRSGF